MAENASGPDIKLFEPPPGGDITLRSSDGTSFRAHSLLMSLASSTFQDMVSVGVHGDGIIDLAEDAESISLMLEHVYPVKSPNIQSIGAYAKCLEVARKYDVKGMMDTLTERLCLGERNEVVNANPVEACILADAFGLHNASEVAARVADYKVDLRDSNELVNDLGKFPKWKLPIRLFGMQAARAEVLAKVLFSFDHGVMTRFARLGTGPFPLCYTCRKQAAKAPVCVPIWLLRWSMAVYNMALNGDLQTLEDEITDPNSVQRLVAYLGEEDLSPKYCNSCVQYVQSCDDYPTWALAVVNEIRRCTSELNNKLSLS